MTSKEILEYLTTCKFCKIVMGTDYENDDRYPTIYDIFSEEIEIIQKDLDRLEELEKENERLKNGIRPFLTRLKQHKTDFKLIQTNNGYQMKFLGAYYDINSEQVDAIKNMLEMLKEEWLINE